MPEAARVGHEHTCPSTDPQPHRGGPVVTPASKNVETNRKEQARAGDRLTCRGAPATPLSRNQDFIVTGSGSVEVNGKPAARKSDKTMHAQGEITVGSDNVEIGGPTVGAILGNIDAAVEACKKAKDGRVPPQGAVDENGNQLQPNTSGQSYNNCGIEASRQLINTADPNANFTQEGLLTQAQSHTPPLAGTVAGNMRASGSSTPQNNATLLGNNGVPAAVGPNTSQAATMTQITQYVAEGRGVIASTWALISAWVWSSHARSTTPESSRRLDSRAIGSFFSHSGNFSGGT